MSGACSLDAGSELQTKRHGATLIELLSVLAIVGVLLCLLLPALQHGRESSRRTACSNNARQLAIGIQMHVSASGWYPTGGWGSDWAGMPMGSGKDQPGGWIYNTLPYIEQAALHSLGDGLVPGSADQLAANATRISTPIKLLNCPSRRPSRPITNRRAVHLCAELPRVARGDYAINGGSIRVVYGSGPQTLDAARAYRWPNGSTVTGISFVRSQTRPAEVTDGLSETLLIGEKHLYFRHYFTGQDMGDNENLYTGDDLDIVRFTGRPFERQYAPRSDTATAIEEGRVFGSAHPSGVVIAYCDGAVHVASYDINQDIFSGLGNIRDGR